MFPLPQALTLDYKNNGLGYYTTHLPKVKAPPESSKWQPLFLCLRRRSTSTRLSNSTTSTKLNLSERKNFVVDGLRL